MGAWPGRTGAEPGRALAARGAEPGRDQGRALGAGSEPVGGP